MNSAPIVREAHALAARLHAGQTRKANGAPYLDHVVGVAETLAEAGFDAEVVAGGLLHDTVEHTELALGEVEARFGERVGSLVAAMSDDDSIESWEERKAEHRRRVRVAGRDACGIYAADKLCGIGEARDGYAEVAEGVEERLGNPLDVRMRVWEADLEMIEAIEPPLPFATGVGAELEALRGDLASLAPRR